MNKNSNLKNKPMNKNIINYKFENIYRRHDSNTKKLKSTIDNLQTSLT